MMHHTPGLKSCSGDTDLAWWPMYAEFTDHARNAMKLADKAAKRLNHEFIGTEDILIGLVEESSGLASRVLHTVNVDLGSVPASISKFVLPGPKRF